MSTPSPALLTDLAYAVGRYGLTLADVPCDYEGLTLADRLALLVEDGQAHPHSDFRRSDLRAGAAPVWDLFPENPVTAATQLRLIDEVSELLHAESEHHTLVRGSELPRREHVDSYEQLLRFIDGLGGAPDVVPEMWSDTTVFDEAAEEVPLLRDAEGKARMRALLVTDLTSGALPPASALCVRDALDSEQLRHADITLAAHQVRVTRLRDTVQMGLDALYPHFEVAERIRRIRDDLDVIDTALHWPGHWQSAPTLRAA